MVGYIGYWKVIWELLVWKKYQKLFVINLFNKIFIGAISESCRDIPNWSFSTANVGELTEKAKGKNFYRERRWKEITADSIKVKLLKWTEKETERDRDNETEKQK